MCECGNPKTRCSPACERCMYLDGTREKHADVIAVLRGTDGMSVKELCEEILGDTSNTPRTAMMRTLHKLEEYRRVRRYWRDGDRFEIRTTRWGPSARISHGNSGGCWVYALDGMTAEEQRRRAA